MSAVALREFNPNLVAGVSQGVDSSPDVRARNDAQLDIREIEALRLDVDTVAPPEAAALTEPLVDLFRGQMTSGDNLRLPRMTNFDGPSTRAAVSRIIRTPLAAAAAPREAIAKEKKMHLVLRALDSVVTNIHGRANMTARY